MPLNDKLRRKWEERGLLGSRASSAAVLPPPVGFRRVYHLSSAAHAVTNIVFGRIKVARFSELNDPFELSALNLRNKKTRNLIEMHKQQIDRQFGLLCFSADWKDPVLWSHYGAQHRGICLGFDIDETIAIEISYQDRKLAQRLDENVKNIDPTLAETLIKTKFKSWQYEEEWRALVPLSDTKQEGKLHFFPFQPRLRLREVILGSSCDFDVDAVRELTEARNDNVKVYKARLASGLFGIVPDEDNLAPDVV
jgi:Protein of unknown function (DUF2971)